MTLVLVALLATGLRDARLRDHAAAPSGARRRKDPAGEQSLAERLRTRSLARTRTPSARRRGVAARTGYERTARGLRNVVGRARHRRLRRLLLGSGDAEGAEGSSSAPGRENRPRLRVDEARYVLAIAQLAIKATRTSAAPRAARASSTRCRGRSGGGGCEARPRARRSRARGRRPRAAWLSALSESGSTRGREGARRRRRPGALRRSCACCSSPRRSGVRRPRCIDEAGDAEARAHVACACVDIASGERPRSAGRIIGERP